MEIRELYDGLYRYCYMKTHHPQAAEDITQEAFLRFLKRYRFTEEAETSALLYTIARNLCTDYYRSGREETWRGIGENSVLGDGRRQGGMAENGMGLSGVMQDDMGRYVTRMALESAMEQLEETDREAVFFRYVMELPAGETADILGISRFQLYRREKRALKQLRSQLNRRDFYE